MCDSMNKKAEQSAGEHIVVCVITYQRPRGLQKLLDSLAEMQFSRVDAPEVTVVVVDNDPKGSAAQVVGQAPIHAPWMIHFPRFWS